MTDGCVHPLTAFDHIPAEQILVSKSLEKIIYKLTKVLINCFFKCKIDKSINITKPIFYLITYEILPIKNYFEL